VSLETWLWIFFGLTAAQHLYVSKFVVGRQRLLPRDMSRVLQNNALLVAHAYLTPMIYAGVLLVGFLKTDQGWWYLLAIVLVWLLPPAIPTPRGKQHPQKPSP
jgi:hypothetical protein